MNVAFLCAFLGGDIGECVGILQSHGRVAEAAMLARSYAPSMVGESVVAWRDQLQKVNDRAAKALADPEEYPNLFPAHVDALAAESWLSSQKKTKPASTFPDEVPLLDVSPIERMKLGVESGASDESGAANDANADARGDAHEVDAPTASSEGPAVALGAEDAEPEAAVLAGAAPEAAAPADAASPPVEG